MDIQLSSLQRVVAPEPRPAMTGPSTAARDPDPKPIPDGDLKPRRHHDHHRAERNDEHRGRSHVQQGLRHIVREIRHALRDEVRAGVKSGELDHQTMESIRDLQRDFHRDLQSVFHDAGNGGGIDRAEVLKGMIEALQSLAAGLREIADDDPIAADPQPEKLDPALSVFADEPGSLVDITG